MIAIQWLPKSRDSLPSTKPHSSSQNHIRRVASSRVWAVGLLPKSFWDRNGHGLWVFYYISPFPMHLGCFQWSLSCYSEVCRVNSTRTHSFWWDGGLRRARGAEAVWKMVDQLLLSHLKGWKLLFLSLLVKVRHDVGSTSSRYTAHPLIASISDFIGPTNRLPMAVWVLGCSFFGL